MGVGCSMDGGDCDLCLEQISTDPANIGDGYCDLELNTTACGWDGLDCLGGFGSDPTCQVPDKAKLGDGLCDGGVYNTEACGYDNGDCTVCNSKVSTPKRIGTFHFFMIFNVSITFTRWIQSNFHHPLNFR